MNSLPVSRALRVAITLTIVLAGVVGAVGRADDATQDARPAVSAPTGNETVYVTKTGEKYHREGCRHLSKSRIPKSLKEAAARYGPCSVCQPPVLTATAPVEKSVERTAAPKLKETPTARPAATSGQCQAITKKGTQCSRRAQPGRAYCWQHGR